MKRKPPPGNVRRVASIDRNIRGVTTSKRGRLVQFESEQERKLILLLERDATVADYASQPETLIFQDRSGHTRRYTPDFKVWRTGGQVELHEVTVEHRREQERMQARESAAGVICQERQWRYVIHTERTLPQGNEYLNLSILSMFRACTYLTPDIAEWWRTHLGSSDKSVHPESILPNTPTAPRGLLLNGMYHLIWHDHIGMDWNQALITRGEFNPNAKIWQRLIQDAPTGWLASAVSEVIS